MTRRRLRKVWERTARAREDRAAPEAQAAAQRRLAEALKRKQLAEVEVAFYSYVLGLDEN